MQLIGINVLKENPSVSKLLKAEWYPFGNYPKPKDTVGVVVPERNR